jgi:hypothetical protein
MANGVAGQGRLWRNRYSPGKLGARPYPKQKSSVAAPHTGATKSPLLSAAARITPQKLPLALRPPGISVADQALMGAGGVSVAWMRRPFLHPKQGIPRLATPPQTSSQFLKKTKEHTNAIFYKTTFT